MGELNLFNLQDGGHTCLLHMAPKLFLVTNRFEKAWLNNGGQTAYEALKMKCGPDGLIQGIGKAIKNGKPTSGALMVKLRRSKKLKNNGSVISVETKSGSSGPIVAATLIVGIHTPASGDVAIGPFMNMEREAAQAVSGKRKVGTSTLRASIEEAGEAARKVAKEVAKGVVAKEL